MKASIINRIAAWRCLSPASLSQNRSFPAPTPGIEKFCLDVPIEWGNNSRRSHCRSERRRGGVKKITQFTKETQSMQQHQQQQQIRILYSFVYLLYYIWSCVHMTFWMVVDALIIATGVRLRYVSRRSAKYIISWFFNFAHTHRRPCTMRHIHRIAPLMSCTHAIFRFNQRMHCGAKCAIITFISPVNTLNSFSFSVFFLFYQFDVCCFWCSSSPGCRLTRLWSAFANTHKIFIECTAKGLAIACGVGELASLRVRLAPTCHANHSRYQRNIIIVITGDCRRNHTHTRIHSRMPCENELNRKQPANTKIPDTFFTLLMGMAMAMLDGLHWVACSVRVYSDDRAFAQQQWCLFANCNVGVRWSSVYLLWLCAWWRLRRWISIKIVSTNISTRSRAA